MPASNFIPELWSRLLLESFRKNFVFGNLVNRNYEGEIKQQGDTVHINTPSAVAVRDYSGAVTYDQIASTQQALVIDQAKYYGFEVHDIDAAQANISLESPFITEAAVSLADAVDQSLAALYTEAATSVTASLVATATDQYAKLVEAGMKLDQQNVPRTGRWVVVTPAGYADLLTNDKFIASATAEGRSIVRTGEVGTIAGLTVYVSNNLVRTGSSKVANWLYGSNAAITFAEQITKTESMRREASFADAIRGLLVFGHKVVRPAALGTITVTETT